jgi:Protein of unknown function (DUF1573)
MTSSFIMKGIYGLLLVSLLASCGSNQDTGKAKTAFSDKMPKITFEEDVKNFDFGEIVEGDTIQHKFRFKNTGEFPLIISNISTSCGCTTPEWPREPIATGDEGTILVKFNSKNKQGHQRKVVSIYANTNPAYQDIEFVVNVLPDSTKR